MSFLRYAAECLCIAAITLMLAARTPQGRAAAWWCLICGVLLTAGLNVSARAWGWVAVDVAGVLAIGVLKTRPRYGGHP